jgi:hypothetical protein
VTKKAVKKTAVKKAAVKAKVAKVKAAPAPKPVNVEKELDVAHKILGQASFQIVTMLVTRKMSMTRVRYASDRVRECADLMTGLVARLDSYAASKQ